MEQQSEVSWPVIKVVTAWVAALGIGSWQEAAAFAAFLYSLCLLAEWVYKRVWLGAFGKGSEK